MDNKIGTTERPLRVAIIGAGPSAFYAAAALIAQKDVAVAVDIFDRLPTPFGLVRHGVAPDHEKIKTVTKVYEKIASDPRVRFFGNVEFGTDVTREELHRFYDAVIYAVGASSDRRLGIPGEDLLGSYSATDFVAWYNSHPDYDELIFEMVTAKNAAVVGNGNVAVDVARILARLPSELQVTDIAEHSLDVLHSSPIEKIYMLGRRGPVQAAFTNPELKELGKLEDVDLVVPKQDLELDENSRTALATDKEAAKNYETLKQFAEQPLRGCKRQLILRFLVSPVEIIGKNGHVTALKLERNKLELNASGALQARGTGVFETIAVDMVFRAIGYKGIPMPDVPYDSRSGTIPNKDGRVINPESGEALAGDYVVGWAKRGPTGVIGTNKPDSTDTVLKLLQDVPQLVPAPDASPQAVVDFLRAREPKLVTYEDWRLIDQAEVNRGQAVGKPRVKFFDLDDMMDAIEKAKR